MRFPSWSEFTNKLSDFECDAKNKINEFKEDYPKLDEAIKKAIPLLPPPFNVIGDYVYNSFEGSKIEKTSEVMSYFNCLKNRGEKHYNQTTLQLDNILIQINDLKEITAKETTIEKIRDILISTGKDTTLKLDELKDEIIQIMGVVDQIDKTTKDTHLDVKKVGQDVLENKQLTMENRQMLEKLVEDQKQNFDGLGIKSELREEGKLSGTSRIC